MMKSKKLRVVFFSLILVDVLIIIILSLVTENIIKKNTQTYISLGIMGSSVLLYIIKFVKECIFGSKDEKLENDILDFVESHESDLEEIKENEIKENDEIEDLINEQLNSYKDK